MVSTKELNRLADSESYRFIPPYLNNTITETRYELNFLFNTISQAETCLMLLLILILTCPKGYRLNRRVCLPLGFLLVLLLLALIPVGESPPDRIAWVGLFIYGPLLQVFKVFREYAWAKTLKPKSSGRSNGLLQAIQTALKTISVPLLLLLYAEAGYRVLWYSTLGTAVVSICIAAIYLCLSHRKEKVKPLIDEKSKHIWTTKVLERASRDNIGMPDPHGHVVTPV